VQGKKHRLHVETPEMVEHRHTLAGILDSSVGGRFSQAYMHSEQAIVGALITGAPVIAGAVRAIPADEQIVEFSLNIHTERQMCPYCAAAVNHLLGYIDDRVKMIPDVLRASDFANMAQVGEAVRDRAGAGGVDVRANVWADWQFAQRAKQQTTPQGVGVYIHHDKRAAKPVPKPAGPGKTPKPGTPPAIPLGAGPPDEGQDL